MTPPMTTSHGSGFHPVNVAHLVMGVAFMGLAAVWFLRAAGAVSHHDLHWLLPIPWVAAGLVGLAAVAMPSRTERLARDDEPSISDESETPDPDPEETP